MKEKLLTRLTALLSVKSMVTLALTGVFSWLALKDGISQDFMVIYTVVISFYFGTQNAKREEEKG